MKITISGHHFDTKKATHTWSLEYWDGHNMHTGMVYRSRSGVFYVYTPSQWANMHRWIIMTPEEILNEYDHYLTDEGKEKIANIGGIEWE